VTYTPYSNSLTVTWEGYHDPESDIWSYQVALWNKSTCTEHGTEMLMVDWITLTSNYSQYMFTELELNVCYVIIPLRKITSI